jgi:hypothetical protein
MLQKQIEFVEGGHRDRSRRSDAGVGVVGGGGHACVKLLQVRDVFADVVNGKRAKRNEVLQAFETDDLDVVSFFVFHTALVFEAETQL